MTILQTLTELTKIYYDYWYEIPLRYPLKESNLKTIGV